jgi:hypothetical protein
LQALRIQNLLCGSEFFRVPDGYGPLGKPGGHNSGRLRAVWLTIGRGALLTAILGSVVSAVLARSTVPVVVVNPHAAQP